MENLTYITNSLMSTPLANVKTLVKLGFEPVPEFPSRTLFGKEGFARLSIIKCAREVQKTYGFGALFRGTILGAAEDMVRKELTPILTRSVKRVAGVDFGSGDDEEEGEETLLSTVYDYSCTTVALTATLFLTQPFRVIARNMVASAVDSNDIYNTLRGTVEGIFHDFGLSGFWRGFTAEWIGTTTNMWLVGIGAYLIRKSGILNNTQKNLRQIGDLGNKAADYLPTLAASIVVNYATYPLNVVATMGSIAKSKLMLANAPYQPEDTTWQGLYQFLLNLDGSYFSTRSMFRAASGLLFNRWYPTPHDIGRLKVALD